MSVVAARTKLQRKTFKIMRQPHQSKRTSGTFWPGLLLIYATGLAIIALQLRSILG